MSYSLMCAMLSVLCQTKHYLFHVANNKLFDEYCNTDVGLNYVGRIESGCHVTKHVKLVERARLFVQHFMENILVEPLQFEVE